MHPNEIRASFLTFFERQGHRVVPSAPLVPADDPTLLFTNAGMNQFKDAFLGRERRGYTRATTAQKCMRVSGKHNDLDTVGPSPRHHTFFEMLGNFSFGDYFKHDAIAFAWTLLTREWGLDPSRLYVTVFRGEQGVPRDEDAWRRWRDFVPSERIGALGMDDNFWAMGDTGPCGRCSEIYYDRGPEVAGTGDFLRDVESGSERFIEIWNNVFMEFERAAGGTLADLPAPSIDTGMGLERIAAVLGGVLSNYDTALFTPILRAVGDRAAAAYGGSPESDVSMRVIADHLRAMTFLIADGVVPSNEWRGYVLRKIMRRAMRHGRKLGLTTPFLHELADIVIAEMGDAYRELRDGRDAIVQVIRGEEERFDAVLAGGLPRLEDVLDRAARADRIVPGDEAFRLYDTWGLPRDFIEDLAAAQGLRFDAAGFERAMEGQREKARAKSAFGGGSAVTWVPRPGATELPDRFCGYDRTDVQTRVVELFRTSGERREPADELRSGEEGFAALAETPFYVEAGGQVSDAGRLESASVEVEVGGVVRPRGLPRLHAIEVVSGTLRVGDEVTARIDVRRRDATRSNHTATHVLHAALRAVLGPHVKQAGSLVAPDRLRFDFVHGAPTTPDELQRVERIVNDAIRANAPVTTAIRDRQEAMAAGAVALFGEKYEDRVRVVTIGDGTFSTELCGGTHVSATGDIGLLLIAEESGIAAGVRRIEAVTGGAAIEVARAALDERRAALDEVGARPGELLDRIRSVQADLSRAQKEIQQLRTKLALGGGGAGPSSDGDQVEIGGVTVVLRRVTDVDKASLRALADALKSRLASGVVFLAAPLADGKVAMVATVTPDLVKKVQAGRLVKELAPIVGGGGGGRPDFAEAGGKDADRIPAMLAAAREVVERMMR